MRATLDALRAALHTSLAGKSLESALAAAAAGFEADDCRTACAPLKVAEGSRGVALLKSKLDSRDVQRHPMLNRFNAKCLILALLLQTGRATDHCADEVSWLQSSRPSPRPATIAEGFSAWLSRHGLSGAARMLHTAEPTRPRGVSFTELVAGRDRMDLTVAGLAFAGVLTAFFCVTLCLVRAAWVEDKPKAEVPVKEVPFVQPAESIRSEAMPAICPKFLGASMDQPFLVSLKPLQDKGDWTLQIRSQHSQRVRMTAALRRAGHLANLRRSFVEVRSENDQLLGRITSRLEILMPDGRTFGCLVPFGGAHLLQEESGREARWSVAEEQGTISTVWLPKMGSSQRNLAELRDGLHKLGGRSSHNQKGALLATLARPEGSNGHRLELMSMNGVDSVLVLLCALGLVAFENALDLVDSAEFAKEKTGHAILQPVGG
ncbi:unnamed protein product [Effrenium voratum]|uniref:Uncharacterized protein n=1 Tax=Effrenium voratum TaxID=2562239 RepID=A0AA36MQ75_9DINO|nr:unnamed protein product [Effrenium voratum]